MAGVVDALASAPWYVPHLAPVWRALSEDCRGEFIAGNNATAAAVRAEGIQPTTAPLGGRQTLVAGWGDLRTARKARCRVALMEHGIGQSYGGRPNHIMARHASYAGGRDRDAELFLHPGSHPAQRDKTAYPKARVEIVGSPALDDLPDWEPTDGPVIAVAFHWRYSGMPETMPAINWIEPAMRSLAKKYLVLGSGHPRSFGVFSGKYRLHGIEPVAGFAEVCRRADLLIADNTSVLYLFAATGRPVVVLDPPWYDRNAEHGLRFWEAANVGVRCEDPAALADCVAEALEDWPEQRAAREAALDKVFGYRSGAAERAAQALVEWAA